MKTKQRSMTQGVIWKEIILFSIPLLIGNLFQQLYNTVDSFVVGKFVGDNALAAVGASNPLANLIIGFFMGIAAGAGIVISRYFGAKKIEELRDSISTFIAFSFLVSLALTFLGLFMSPILLRWLGTPEIILDQAVVYLQIYFWGIMGLVMYNSGAGILRAIGDSKTPLLYLIVSSVINVSLDLFFVIVLDLGIQGVAYATLIAQASSAVLVMIHLTRIDPAYRFSFKRMKLHPNHLYDIVRLGVPTGIQQMVVSFSNVLVQSYVNQFGSLAVAGFTAADKYNGFLGMPTQTFALTITTFTGQNLGAGKKERVGKGIRLTLSMAIGILIFLGIPTYIAAPTLISIFSDNPEVINYGTMMLRIMLPAYPILAITQVLLGSMRGAGSTFIPMLIMVFSFTVVRQIFLFVMFKISMDISWVYWSYSFTWVISAILALVYSKKSQWLEKA